MLDWPQSGDWRSREEKSLLTLIRNEPPNSPASGAVTIPTELSSASVKLIGAGLGGFGDLYKQRVFRSSGMLGSIDG
jgi:hypothetical protein